MLDMSKGFSLCLRESPRTVTCVKQDVYWIIGSSMFLRLLHHLTPFVLSNSLPSFANWKEWWATNKHKWPADTSCRTTCRLVISGHMGLSFTETFFEAPPPSARRTLHGKISETLSQTLQLVQWLCNCLMIWLTLLYLLWGLLWSVKTSVPLTSDLHMRVVGAMHHGKFKMESKRGRGTGCSKTMSDKNVTQCIMHFVTQKYMVEICHMFAFWFHNWTCTRPANRMSRQGSVGSANS